MAQEPENLTLIQLRELRELVEHRFDILANDMIAVQAELRETRSALVGVGHLVSLLSGDTKAALDRIGARLERLERERA